MDYNEIIEIKENTLFFLYRRDSPEHIKALYEKGEVYINTIDFIRECDQNEDRSDTQDGISTRSFLGAVKVKLCDIGQDINKDGISLDGINGVMVTDSDEKGNIYCLNGIYSEHLMDERNDLEFNTKTFGKSLILIHSPQKFIDRILETLKNKGYENVKYNRVSYHSNDYSGQIGFFKKHEKFKHQNEFRFFIPNKQNEPIKIYIGPLNDIATIENNDLLKITYTDNKEQTIKLV
ncbi:hypothetical protein [Spirosoma endophyticum]|uniref:Uncharacterized protein n=1 Tax=Spirosoma endophyticum TaxID=662367 RepID=A0A1I1MG42_9BACT|nr:hypothetical protein [Spirosoma endophyticum]SFC84106.1 hypothetical protein SAMN05216167_102558 [Spirosoma endophyticum]